MKELLNSVGLLILRVGIGGLMVTQHGWEKLMSFSANSSQFPDPLGVGPVASMALIVLAEFFCSAAIVIGLFTRLAAIPLFVGMIVAALMIHGTDPMAKKEMALLYVIPALTLIFTGPGKISADALIFRPKIKKTSDNLR